MVALICPLFVATRIKMITGLHKRERAFMCEGVYVCVCVAVCVCVYVCVGGINV